MMVVGEPPPPSPKAAGKLEDVALTAGATEMRPT
jgi:hypothetical protein